MKKVMNYAFSVHWERLKVLFLIMRLFSLIMLLGTLTVSAKSWSQQTKIDLQMQNSSVSDILLSIENGSRYFFIYDAGLINAIEKKSIEVKGKNIEEVLDQLFKETSVAYRISDRQVFLYEKNTLPSGLLTGQEQINVKGRVLDSSGNPLPGVAVVVKGTTSGTVTDGEGRYNLGNVPSNAMLVFSFIGLKTQEMPVNGKTLINVVLSEETVGIEEVVVTSMGITREKKALGYAISEVDGESLQKAKQTNVINSLAGSVAGLVINQTAGGPSGSSNVLIRGVTDLTGVNQPLYVVDGVPLDASTYGQAKTWSGFDLGDDVSTVAADNIESMTVLKGPAASALYGSRASHGAIIITTKKASKEAFSVEFNNSTTFEYQTTYMGDLQRIYGPGYDGQVKNGNGYSADLWGPKYDKDLQVVSIVDNALSQNFDLANGAITIPFEYKPNYLNDFFRVGITSTSTLSVSTFKNQTGMRLAYTNLSNRDYKPNSNMQRQTLNLGVMSKLGKKLDLSVNVNYVGEHVLNRPGLSGDNSNVGKLLNYVPPTIEITSLEKIYQDESGNYIDFGQRGLMGLNPYWVVYRMKNESDKSVLRSSLNLKYSFSEKFNISANGGANFSEFEFMNFIPPTTPDNLSGNLSQQFWDNKTYNLDVKATYSNSIGKVWYSGVVGGTIYKVCNKKKNIFGTDMLMDDVLSINSFLNRNYSEDIYEKQINSLWALVQTGYKSIIFLDATLRMDHSSTLPAHNNVYYYPSVSGSFLFSSLFNIDKKLMPLGKLRASWANTGSDSDPYLINLTYSATDNPFNGYGRGYISNSIIPNKDLKPTMTNSFEIGLETSLLDNRIGLDVTLYKQRSKDQIMNLNTSMTSGYENILANVGLVENKGIEIELKTTPVILNDFRWDLFLNFAKNKNKVLEITPGVDTYVLQDAAWTGAQIVAQVGKAYGAIIGPDYLRSPDGEVILNPSNGLPATDSSHKLSEVGNISWDWSGGIVNSFTYKRATLKILTDVKVGADILSITGSRSLYYGKNPKTIEGRDEWYKSEEQRLAANVDASDWNPTGGYIVDGVYEIKDDQGSVVGYEKNTTPVNPEVYYKYIADNFPRPCVYDNSYVKIRQITFSYELPERWLKGVADNATLSLVAINPLILYKNVPYIDPESSYNTSFGGGIEYGSLPTRRSYGFNVIVKF